MSSSQSGFFIPVIFPDEDDESNNFSAPFMGHGGFILVNPNTNVATCYEYGNTQTNPDPTNTNPQVTSNPKSGALRTFVLSGTAQYDSNGNITQSSIENMLSQITSTNYSSSDPGIVFASPFAISPAQYNSAANQISTYRQEIAAGEFSGYSVFKNNCLNFTYDIAESIGLTISTSQTTSNTGGLLSAWPNIVVKNILAVSNFGYEYTAANSWNGQSIAEVNAQNYVTQTYIHDQFQLLVDSSAFKIPILDGYLAGFLVGKVIGELSDNIGSGGASFSATSNQLGNGALQLNENDGLGDQLVETLGTTSTVIGLVVNGQSSGGVGVSVIESNAITPALSNGSELVVGSNGGFTFTANASLQTFLDIGGTNADFIGGSFSDLTEIVNPGTVSGTTIGSSSNNTFSFSGGTNVLIGDLGNNTFIEAPSITSATNIIWGGGGTSTYSLTGYIDILHTTGTPTPSAIENLSSEASMLIPDNTYVEENYWQTINSSGMNLYGTSNVNEIIDPGSSDELSGYAGIYTPVPTTFDNNDFTYISYNDQFEMVSSGVTYIATVDFDDFSNGSILQADGDIEIGTLIPGQESLPEFGPSQVEISNFVNGDLGITFAGNAEITRYGTTPYGTYAGDDGDLVQGSGNVESYDEQDYIALGQGGGGVGNPGVSLIGSTEVVPEGQSAAYSDIGSGGVLSVLSGGGSNGSNIAPGGQEIVDSGGVASGSTIDGGTQIISTGATAYSTTILNSGFEIVSGGTSFEAIVEKGGSEVVKSGGIAIGANVLIGGVLIVSATGISSATTVQAGGDEFVSGGSAYATSINSGTQNVFSGATASASVVGSGGKEDVYAGGSTNFDIVDTGGIENIFAGGAAVGAIVSSSGLEVVYSGGTATSSVINSRGFEIVFSGGSATTPTVSSGGHLISSGVVDAESSSISAYSSAPTGLTVSQGGNEYVLQGSTVSNTQVNNGGNQWVGGGAIALATSISSGGTQTILAGGQASNTTIGGGGAQVVSGGMAYASTITSGGTLLAETGATLIGGITFSGVGGELIDSPANLSKDTITGFGVGDTIELSGLGYDEGARVTVAKKGIVSIIDDGQTVALNILGATAGQQNFIYLPGDILTETSNVVTLQASTTAVTIKTAINTFGLIGAYAIASGGSYSLEPVGAGLFGPAGTDFTVTNKSLIESNASGPFDAGIVLGSVGTIHNAGTVIGGAGIEIFGSGGTGGYVYNTKTLDATLGTGIYLQGYGGALNYGQLSALGTGILLGAGGYGYNSGTIAASTGILIDGSVGGSVINVGSVSASSYGVKLLVGGSVSNKGTIQSGGYGLLLEAGGTAKNIGQITAKNAISVSGGSVGYIYNSGQISASNSGIELMGLGSVTNQGTIQSSRIGLTVGVSDIAYNYGFISAGVAGAYLSSDATLVETGTLVGGTFAASFASGLRNQLVIDADSSISGTVSGGGGLLDLAADGTLTGTISLGSGQFSNFSTIEVGSGATWSLAGTFVEGTAVSFINNGIIKESAISKGTLDGPISGTGKIKLSTNVFTLAGSVAAGQTIVFTGTGETLALADPSGFGANLSSFVVGDTIDLTTTSLSSITGTTFSKGVLTLAESAGSITLTFASPASFGSDGFSLASAGAGIAITLSTVASMAIMSPSPWLGHSWMSYFHLTANDALAGATKQSDSSSISENAFSLPHHVSRAETRSITRTNSYPGFLSGNVMNQSLQTASQLSMIVHSGFG